MTEAGFKIGDYVSWYCTDPEWRKAANHQHAVAGRIIKDSSEWETPFGERFVDIETPDGSVRCVSTAYLTKVAP